MNCVVVGLGEFGRTAAIALTQSGADVIAIDLDMKLVDKVKDDVSMAICLDAAQEDALKMHGIAEADTLLAAIGHNFEAQVLVVLYAKKLGIGRVIARATTPDHARILEAIGVDEVVRPEEEAARLIVQRLMIPNINRYFELADCFSIIELAAPDILIGKTLRELDLRRKYRINLVAIQRTVPGTAKDQATLFNPVPEPDEHLQPGDILTMVGSDLDLAGFMAKYS